MAYRHTQRSPAIALPFAIGIACELGAWFAPPGPDWVLLALGVVFLSVGACFGQLRAVEAGDHLEVSFGPLPLFRRKVRYDAIRDVRRGRSAWIDGWGIHWLPGRGVIWNLWGRDCVELDLEGARRLRIGTDDVEGLFAHLRARAPA